MPGKLGRLVPTDWDHYDKYPLTADTTPETPRPVVWGVNWYSNFDDPEQKDNGEYWIGEGELGWIRGGHAIASPYSGANDRLFWHEFYDQGSESACVGYSWSRAMSWLNRYTYNGFWLYKAAQQVDEWQGEDYEGTSVRAGGNILTAVGHSRRHEGEYLNPSAAHGISTYRWINDVEDFLNIVGGIQKERGAVTWRNSWGTSYPHKVWLPAETAQRLIDEDGEVCVPTDK